MAKYTDEQVLKIVEEFEEEGCSCSALDGWICGVHKIAREVRDGLS